MKRKIGNYLTIIIILIWSLTPIYWALRTSLLSDKELMVTPIKYLPTPISLENYKLLFGLGKEGTMVWNQFKKALINSFISSGITTFNVVIISIISGYAFSRFEFKGKKLVFYMLIIIMALPAYSVIIPLYKIIAKLGLLDTQIGITLIYTATFSPLAVWLMRSFFNSIPIELEEAALIDGASRFKSLLTILPLALPGIIAVSVITFLTTWSNFLLPLIFAPLKAKPLTVLITQFVGKSTIDYGLMTAAGVITILPPVIIVIFLNKYLVSGLMAGAVKE